MWWKGVHKNFYTFLDKGIKRAQSVSCGFIWCTGTLVSHCFLLYSDSFWSIVPLYFCCNSFLRLWFPFFLSSLNPVRAVHLENLKRANLCDRHQLQFIFRKKITINSRNYFFRHVQLLLQQTYRKYGAAKK